MAATQELSKAELEKRAAKAVTKARTHLTMGVGLGNDASAGAKTAFFGSLALRLRVKADWSERTAAVDGRTLYYNPAFIEEIQTIKMNAGAANETEVRSLGPVLGLVVHEVMHCAFLHFARQGSRELRLWNVACDLAINHIILESGFLLPSHGCVPGEGPFAQMPKGLSAEQYYTLLKDAGASADGGEGADPGGCGGVKPGGSGDESSSAELAGQWQVAVAQAKTMAARAGTLPAGIGLALGEILEPKVHWREVLRRFVSAVARNDYSWAHPNRRHIANGLYLPSLRSEELGDVAITIDTSGSISKRQLTEFAAEIQGVLDAYTVNVRILYHDVTVPEDGEERWTSADGPLTLTPKGGGGTSHLQVLEAVADEAPTLCICFTDGATVFPDSPPDFPILWALTEKCEVPFGEKLVIE